jgi:integral membrane protein
MRGWRRLASRLVPGYVRDEDAIDPDRGLAGAVLHYRIMAWTVGTGLLILVFVGVPLQYGAGIPQVSEIVGPFHGFLYIVYLLCAVDLARRARFTLLQMAAMIAAGFLPFVAFFIEHRVMKRLALMAPDAGGPGDAVAVADGSDAA